MAESTVIVCDDHPLFRNGVELCLEKIPGIKVVAHASDAASARAKLELYTPDILITDLSLPGESGLELLSWAKQFNRELIVVVLSMHTEMAFVQRARELGAAGFLAKEDAETELVNVLTQSRGEFYTSQSIGSVSQRELPDLELLTKDEELFRYLSAAELKVLQLLAESLTSKSIAEKLNISPRTVEAHRRRISEKLDLKGPNRLMEFAVKHRSQLGAKK